MFNTRIRLTLHPGQNGAKQLQAQYGDRLVCVRYRSDEHQQKRFKTVELIVEEREWRPDGGQWTNERLVGVQIAAREVELRGRIKQAGGRWDAQRQVWELRYEQAVALGVTERIVKAEDARHV
jgi:hypothetical protein